MTLKSLQLKEGRKLAAQKEWDAAAQQILEELKKGGYQEESEAITSTQIATACNYDFSEFNDDIDTTISNAAATVNTPSNSHYQFDISTIDAGIASLKINWKHIFERHGEAADKQTASFFLRQYLNKDILQKAILKTITQGKYKRDNNMQNRIIFAYRFPIQIGFLNNGISTSCLKVVAEITGQALTVITVYPIPDPQVKATGVK